MNELSVTALEAEIQEAVSRLSRRIEQMSEAFNVVAEEYRLRIEELEAKVDYYHERY